MNISDCIVIGGGVVGAAIAYGLGRRGLTVAMIDQGDDAFRASRANFGLVWIQSKGLGRPEYAAWSRQSSELWTDFAAELADETGVDCAYHRPGGITLALNDVELDQHVQSLRQIRRESGNQPLEFDVLERHQLDEMLPGLGPNVVGGTYCPHDGEANSLYLLRALHAAIAKQGGTYQPNLTVTAIEAITGGGYTVRCDSGERFEAAKVVIAAGLGNRALGAMVGMDVPVRPVQGQILVTERADPVLDLPTLSVKQTREGTFMLGFSTAEIDFDTETQPDVARDIAWRNSQFFPFLSQLRLVRTWVGLRVMTPDGFPIYEQSTRHPGVFVATGHSGVTTAAVHALVLAGWFADGALPAHMRALSTERFHVQTA